MRRRWVCANCGNAQRKGYDCKQCGMPLEDVAMDLNAFTIGIWGCVAWLALSLTVVFAGLVRGVCIPIPVGIVLTLMLAFVLSFWDDDWMDKHAKRIADGMRPRATRCPVCGTALVLHEATMRWSCPRCRMPVVSFESPIPAPPPAE